jgi:hypothetical protein
MTSTGPGEVGELAGQDAAAFASVAAEDAWISRVLAAVVDADNALYLDAVAGRLGEVAPRPRRRVHRGRRRRGQGSAQSDANGEAGSNGRRDIPGPSQSCPTDIY